MAPRAGGSEVVVKSMPRQTKASEGGSASHAKSGWSPRVFDHTRRYAAGCGVCHARALGKGRSITLTITLALTLNPNPSPNPSP